MKRGRKAVLLLAGLLIASCTSSGPASGGSPSGPVDIVLAQGNGGTEAATLMAQIAEFNRTHPGIHVTEQYYGNSDYALQKVETEIAGGSYPDIVYLYGAWSANIATSPKVVALNSYIRQDPSFNWNDFWPAERASATVNGKIVGIPALVDNLALVYNKRLFDGAGVSYPTSSWTWDDFRSAAQRLTDPAKRQYGWAYTADGSEDTVWRFDAMLWNAGTDILTPDQQHAAFDSPGGLRAMTLLHDMAVQDQSVYLDRGNGAYKGLFESGHIAMLWTGPWDLRAFIQSHTHYGVQILPASVSHATVAGPDNWVVLDNGSARSHAAFEFLNWLSSAKQTMQFALATSDLPVRQSAMQTPQYAQFTRRYPGIATFVENLRNARARPAVTTYPKISQVLGQAVVSVLLNKAQPQAALDTAKQQVDSILAAGSS